MEIHKKSQKDKHKGIENIKNRLAAQSKKLQHEMCRNPPIANFIVNFHSRDYIAYSGEPLRRALECMTCIFKEIQIVICCISAEDIKNKKQYKHSSHYNNSYHNF